MLTVWGRPNSINVQKVLWCCTELGLSPRRIAVGGEFGGNQDADYVAMNPNRLVPTLDDGGYQLWESNVIVRYLAHQYGQTNLFPTDVKCRFDAERWMDWQATALWPALRPLFIGLIRTPPEKRDRSLLKEVEERCAAAMSILDARLADRAFVSGDTLSMADIPAGASVYRWYALDIKHPDLPNLRRWYEILTERPAFRMEVMLPLS